MLSSVRDVNIEDIKTLPPPASVKKELPAWEKELASVLAAREAIANILTGKDSRMLAIVGPCSIHDAEAAIAYASELVKLAEAVKGEIVVVMRAYFAKPRTTVGWKGLFYDPNVNGSYEIAQGARLVREVALGIVEAGLPIGTEILDPFMIQYIDDLVAWGSIGARTVESQIHREMASALSAPIGLKNDTSGHYNSAVDAIETANHAHWFPSMNDAGAVAYMHSRGNQHAHLVLRGGKNGPGYFSTTVRAAQISLRERGLLDSIVIDCSHGNSGKKPERQEVVLENILDQRLAGNQGIVGFMLESNIVGGRQDIPADGDLSKLVYGQSVTDSCLDFPETARIMLAAAHRLKSG